ncbi:DUF6597 domain-containing transcriptional factor [Streptacidiphilus monticola]|uniref:DUF6597 domain-containing transcriptional factor n=1 Tax=Streptacidiphilus monticola TaxID=2161674 RepID=A0ABW1G1U6_9ACTN
MSSQTPRGVLRPRRAGDRFRLQLLDPGEELAPYVEYHWIVRWDMEGLPPYEQQVLSHPNVHLVFEQPQPLLYGVVRGVYTRRLSGRGQVHGVRFRPGGFRPFSPGPVQELSDRVLPAEEVFGHAAVELNAPLLACTDDQEMRARVEAFLRPLLPPVPDPQAAAAAAAVAAATADHRLVRVEQLAERQHVSVRTLQRLFAEYVGVSPKWVLRRARLQEAATRADQGAVDWTALAAELGYADQAHLVRDFSAVVGQPPARYAAGRSGCASGPPRSG